ncbi:hypothetical protein [Dactylosporangium sp. NPDC051541]|uniref:hypothetical protein n=1 Tax=Dactylosporangium sp. NPDC051541 TaxID=3363977 RepID=UPI003795E13D
MIDRSTLAQGWTILPLRRVLQKQKRPISVSDDVVTAYRDGVVTLRSYRREDGYTFSDLEQGYQGVRKGDLVFHALDGFAGAVGVADADGKCSPVYHVCTPLRDGDTRYIAYVLRAMGSSGFLALQAGAVRQRSVDFRTWETFARLPILFPPSGEQKRISDFLDDETARIGLLEASLRKQRELLMERESASLRLSVAGARLDAGGIASGVPWIPAMHPQARVVRLIRILQLQRGVDLAESERQAGEVVVVTTAGVVGTHNVAIDSGPGVVVGRYGSAGSVHWIPGKYWPHNTTLYVRSFNGNDRRYCYHLLRSLPYEMEQARSAIPGINRNDLHRQPAILLPLDIQKMVSARLDEEQVDFDLSRRRIRRIEKLIAERRLALITAAVTGQIDATTVRGVDVS